MQSPRGLWKDDRLGEGGHSLPIKCPGQGFTDWGIWGWQFRAGSSNQIALAANLSPVLPCCGMAAKGLEVSEPARLSTNQSRRWAIAGEPAGEFSGPNAHRPCQASSQKASRQRGPLASKHWPGCEAGQCWSLSHRSGQRIPT